jgi:integrase
MGQIHKIGDEYYVEFMARGLKYQQKAGQDLAQAEELLRQIEEKIAKGELLTISREIDLTAFFAEFITYAQAQFHPHTVRRLSSTIRHFENFLKDHLPAVQKLSQVTPRVIEDYKTFGQKRDPLNLKIVNLTLLLLREALEYGIKTGYINDNPTLHIRLMETKGGSPVLSSDDLKKILDHATEVYRPVFVFLHNTGLRPHELEYLTWERVDFNRNVVFIKYREVPLNAAALAVLKDAFVNVIDHKAPVFHDPDGAALSAGEIAVRFAKACLKAGLPPLSIAVLRHNFACALFKMRLSLPTVGKILGIHDAAKLMIYSPCIPVSREDIRAGLYGA